MNRTSARTLAALTFFGLAFALATPASAAPSVDAVEIAGGLDQPVAFTFGPGRALWYVEKDSGEIRVFDLQKDADELFATVSGVEGAGERGMLGIALHPRYPDRPYVYVYATRTAGGGVRNQILRFKDDGGTGSNMRVLMSSPASGSPYHNGGRILFGPDGKLYALVGDGHDPANAQDLSNEERGKVLRLKPNGDVPATNPFDDLVWAYGIRNGFGMAFDPQTERLWETDNGPSCNDEVNRIRKGRNYGWGPSQTCSGTAPRNTNQDGPRPVLPEHFYANPIGITGIVFCDGCALGARSRDAAFVGAVNDGKIRRLILDDARRGIVRQRVFYDHPESTLSLEVGPRGRIYVSDFDSILRLVRR